MSFRKIESINENDEVKRKEVSTKKFEDDIDNQSLKSKEKIIEQEKKFNNEVEESYNTIKKNIDKLSGEKGKIVKKECRTDSKNKELTAAICYEKASYDRIKSIYKDYSEFKKDPNKLLDVIKMREFASNMRERFENCINPNNNLNSEKKIVNDIYKNTYEMWDKLCNKIEVNIEKKEKNTGTDNLDNYYQILENKFYETYSYTNARVNLGFYDNELNKISNSAVIKKEIIDTSIIKYSVDNFIECSKNMMICDDSKEFKEALSKFIDEKKKEICWNYFSISSDEFGVGKNYYDSYENLVAFDNEIFGDKKNVDGQINSPKDYHRNYLRKSTLDGLEAQSIKSEDGKKIDVNTSTIIEGKPDIGHKPEHEFWRESVKAYCMGLTQEEFNDYMNNSDFYQYEDPKNNRSHRFESSYGFEAYKKWF